MSRWKVTTIIKAIFWLSVGIHIFSFILGRTYMSGWRLVHDPFHAILEISGSLIAFYVGFVLLQQDKKNQGTSYNVPIALALFGMGLFDGLHAFYHAGNSFVYFHSLSTLIGGLILSIILIPGLKKNIYSGSFVKWTISFFLLIALASVLGADHLPKMVDQGNFTYAAKFMNLFGGGLLLLSAIKLYSTYKSGGNEDDLLFVLHASLFGLAATMFQESKLWDFSWWSWHGLRLGAYLTAFYFAYKQQIYLHFAIVDAEQTQKTQLSFLASMSHEIRTPLNGIIGMAEALKDEISDQKQGEKVDVILKSSESLLLLVNDILDISKMEANKFELESKVFSLKHLIKHQESLFKPVVQEKLIELKFIVDSEVPEFVVSDELRIQQVLNNLISNAIKFTDRGSVSLEVKCLKSEEDIKWVQFQVKDTGIGIAPADQGKLFNDFVQVDNSISRRFGGTGLGLSIVKKLVSLLGGDIFLASEVGQGTTISFSLPLTIANKGQLESKLDPEDDSSFDFTSKTILVVEDNLVNQAVVTGFLEKVKATVIIVENGQEAIEMLEKNKVDLILMDYHMPIMDGVEAAKKIIELYGANHPPIVALTASTMKEDIDYCLAAGMDDFLSKPIRKSSLYKMLAKYSRADKKAS